MPILSASGNSSAKGFGFSKFVESGPTWASGQTEYTTAGTYSFIPVSPKVSVVTVGGGGGGNGGTGPGSSGGAGGGLGWKNDYPVVIGTPYTVVVGAAGAKNTVQGTNAGDGGDSYFISPAIVKGGGGQGGKLRSPNVSPYQTPRAIPGPYVGDGGGNGGYGGLGGPSYCGGGGGAGGYTGDGGYGGYIPSPSTLNGQAGSGGGGGGGGRGGPADVGGSGGGVGLLGEGPSGAGGTGPSADGVNGFGGSGGGNGRALPGNIRAGGIYGGGGGGADSGAVENGAGGGGAVRIIWGAPGVVRQFPTTNTGDL